MLGPAHSDVPVAPVGVEMSPSFPPPEKKQNVPVHGAAGKVAGGLKREDEWRGGGGEGVIVCLCM